MHPTQAPANPINSRTQHSVVNDTRPRSSSTVSIQHRNRPSIIKVYGDLKKAVEFICISTDCELYSQSMSLSAYYEQIIKEPLLTKEEELDLFLELQDVTSKPSRQTQIRDRIIRANLRFVFKKAKGYSKNDPSLFEDLIAAGNEGLLVAFEKYDPQSGFRFLTYAGWWVDQRILNHMAKQRIVALPIWRQQLSARIQKVLDSKEDITFDELKAQFPDVSEKDLRELFQTRFLTFYIEDLGEDPSFEINPIEEYVNTKIDQERLHLLITNLPSPHREVIELFFGVFDGEDRKAAEVAEKMDLSKERVKTLRKEALEMLKLAMGGINPFE